MYIELELEKRFIDEISGFVAFVCDISDLQIHVPADLHSVTCVKTLTFGYK